MHKFSFVTADNITIVGTHNDVEKPVRSILCLHQMPETKESYTAFMKEAEKHHWLVAAIDFRGHGESTNEGTLNYQEFSDEDHKKYMVDAYEVLREMGKIMPVDTIIGASIGANIAAMLQQQNQIPTSILLSVGENYHSLSPESALKTLLPTQRVLLATSENDARVSSAAEMTKRLAAECSGTHREVVIAGSGHGTELLTDPTLHKAVIDWIANK